MNTSMFLQNISGLLPGYTASHPRRWLSLWEPQTSHRRIHFQIMILFFHVNSRHISPFTSVLIISASSDRGGGWRCLAWTIVHDPPVFLELRFRHCCSVTTGCTYVMLLVSVLWIHDPRSWLTWNHHRSRHTYQSAVWEGSPFVCFNSLQSTYFFSALSLHRKHAEDFQILYFIQNS
jgi:hypothetical protein